MQLAVFFAALTMHVYKLQSPYITIVWPCTVHVWPGVIYYGMYKAKNTSTEQRIRPTR